MSRQIIYWALVLGFIAINRAALPWGGFGHETVGAIAEMRLSDSSRREVRELLLGKTLQSVSTWADAVRPRRQETAPLHYINFPPEIDGPRPEDLATTQGNVYIAVTGYAERLADKSRPHSERAEALMFLTHFVGDLHQPLHCGYAKDAGANFVSVREGGRDSNLHRVWDSGILRQHRDRSPEELAQILVTSATMETIGKYAAEKNVEVWIRESRALVKAGAYYYGYVVCEPAVAPDYLRDNLPVAEQRLLAAGIRLGDLVEEILSTGKSPLPPPPCPLPVPLKADEETTETGSSWRTNEEYF